MSDARRLDPVPPAAGGLGPLERAALARRQGRALDVVLLSGAGGELPTPESLERARRSLLGGAGGSCEVALLSFGGSPAAAALLHAHGGQSDLRSAARRAAAASGLCAGVASSSAAPGAPIEVLAAVAAEGLAIARHAGPGEAVHSELYELVGRGGAGTEITAASADRDWIPRSGPPRAEAGTTPCAAETRDAARGLVIPRPPTDRRGAENAPALAAREEESRAMLGGLRREFATLEAELRQLRRGDAQVRSLLERSIAEVRRQIEERESEAERLGRVTEEEAL
ncbi:MAG: hypothetical protein VX460_15035 [Planctomycetota bacterium]|nr:hypothetical protein [Planctomycetota bacterium]